MARSTLICNDCPAEVARPVAAGLVVEPPSRPAPGPERSGKAYIDTESDQEVSPALHAAMVRATPVRVEFRLDAGRMSFAAAPDVLERAVSR